MKKVGKNFGTTPQRGTFTASLRVHLHNFLEKSLHIPRILTKFALKLRISIG